MYSDTFEVLSRLHKLWGVRHAVLDSEMLWGVRNVGWNNVFCDLLVLVFVAMSLVAMPPPDESHTLCMDMEIAFNLLIKTILQSKVSNELFRMSLNADMIEKCDVSVIERHFEQVYEFMKRRHLHIPTTMQSKQCLVALDNKMQKKLSKVKSRASQEAWAEYESSKWHAILSLSNRYAVRPGGTTSVRLGLLKELWRQERPELLTFDEQHRKRGGGFVKAKSGHSVRALGKTQGALQ